jgi:hypothetical protein
MVSGNSAASPCRKGSRRIRSCPRSSSPRPPRGSSRAGWRAGSGRRQRLPRDIERHHQAFGFRSPADIDRYEALLKEGFNVISEALAALDQVFVDTKFEFGYVTDAAGREKLIYMDEVGTPTAPASGTAQPFAAARSSRSQRGLPPVAAEPLRIRTSCSTRTACPSASPWPGTTSCPPR